MTTVENFKQTMLEMKEFYKDKKNRGTSFQLPKEVALLDFKEEDLPEAAKQEGKTFKQNSADFLTNNQNSCSTAGETVQKDKNIDAFKEKMEKLRQESLKKADDNINEMFDKMIEIGEENPHDISVIEFFADSLASFFMNDILGGLESIIDDIGNKIKEIVDEIVSAIEEAFSDLWSDTKSWFSF